MDPCGTPHSRSVEMTLSSTLTWNFLLGRYDFHQSIISRENPKNGIFKRNILWSILSNAFLKSVNIIPLRRPKPKPVNVFRLNKTS